MKAKVEIHNGISKIILTPENTFEKTMLRDAKEAGRKETPFDIRIAQIVNNNFFGESSDRDLEIHINVLTEE